MTHFQPNNSAVHAIEALQGLELPAQGILTLRIREALYWLERSVKFTAPPNGEFLERLDAVSEGVDFPHLPFPSICIEYDYVLNPEQFPVKGVTLADKADQPDRVCVLAFYPDPKLPTGQLAMKDYGPFSQGEFLVWPVVGFNAGRTIRGEYLTRSQWMPSLDPVVVTQERRSPWAMEMRGANTDKRILLHTLPTPESLRARIESKLATGQPAQTQEELVSEIIVDAGWEAMSVVELCNVLECVNVSTRVFEAPAKLNKKRVAHGRVPFFAYHVLELQEAGSRNPAQGGVHASPRQHYRRGHIRRLSAGRKTWVRPTLVGDAARGRIVKDYDTRGRVTLRS